MTDQDATTTRDMRDLSEAEAVQITKMATEALMEGATTDTQDPFGRFEATDYHPIDVMFFSLCAWSEAMAACGAGKVDDPTTPPPHIAAKLDEEPGRLDALIWAMRFHNAQIDGEENPQAVTDIFCELGELDREAVTDRMALFYTLAIRSVQRAQRMLAHGELARRLGMEDPGELVQTLHNPVVHVLILEGADDAPVAGDAAAAGHDAAGTDQERVHAQSGAGADVAGRG